MSEKRQKFVCKLQSDSTQFMCSVCKNIICEPHQVTCCGAVSCQECIRAQKDAEKPCWSCKCNSDNYDSVPDKRFNEAMVKCPKGYKGCQWTGKFRMLKEHLNPEPAPERRLNGCQFYKIHCLYCNELVRRSKVNDHQCNVCPKRPFTCKYCKHKSNYEDIKKNHEATCGEFRIACPKGCGQKIFRKDAKTHKCPEDIIDCISKYAGCTEKVKRKNLESHIKLNKTTHKCMRKIHKDEASLQQANRQQASLHAPNDLNDPPNPPVCPVELTLSNFNQYEPANQDWSSTPFYNLSPN